MNTYEITCNAIALVSVVVRAESRGEAMELAHAQVQELPVHVLAGGTSIGFVDWVAEGGAKAVSA